MNDTWRNRRALVTGATGLVGPWLIEELIRRGAHVTALVLDDDPQSRFYREGIADSCGIVRGNLTNVSDCMRAIGTHEVEVIFHLAAQTLVGNALRDPLTTFESNIRGTYNLLEAARRLAPLIRSFVVASSDKAYGESPVLPLTEACRSTDDIPTMSPRAAPTSSQHRTRTPTGCRRRSRDAATFTAAAI
jgi:CDP-glucose 4,6-dehydratase